MEYLFDNLVWLSIHLMLALLSKNLIFEFSNVFPKHFKMV